jgi:hypothetical protein
MERSFGIASATRRVPLREPSAARTSPRRSGIRIGDSVGDPQAARVGNLGREYKPMSPCRAARRTPGIHGAWRFCRYHRSVSYPRPPRSGLSSCLKLRRARLASRASPSAFRQAGPLRLWRSSARRFSSPSLRHRDRQSRRLAKAKEMQCPINPANTRTGL